MSALSTCIWLSPQDGPRAVELWTSVVPDARVVQTTTLTNDDQADGQIRLWILQVGGREVRVMAAGGEQPFTSAHSMWLEVADQAELDRVWDGFLAAGGQELACGWIRDPFGVQWQVVPTAWDRLTSGDPATAQRVAEAVWQMIRIDVAGLERAAQEQ